jgi:anti-sigma B factor antagonist
VRQGLDPAPHWKPRSPVVQILKPDEHVCGLGDSEAGVHGESFLPVLARLVAAHPGNKCEWEKISVVWVLGNRWKALLLELSHRILPSGETVAEISGELDGATAEIAVRYVTEIIDRHRGPMIADLTALRFCDAQGLSALLHMASYAEQAGCPFRLSSPSPMLVRVIRTADLDRRLPIVPYRSR